MREKNVYFLEFFNIVTADLNTLLAAVQPFCESDGELLNGDGSHDPSPSLLS